MRHYYHFNFLKEKHLVILITLVFFIGLALKASAQSMMLGNEFDALQASMKIKLDDETCLLIPKMTEEQMLIAQDAEQYMMVFKTNGDKGFYAFQNQNWIQLKTREAIINAHNNMQLALTDLNAIILIFENNKTIELVDYNQHISNINTILYRNSQNYAVNDLEKD